MNHFASLHGLQLYNPHTKTHLLNNLLKAKGWKLYVDDVDSGFSAERCFIQLSCLYWRDHKGEKLW